MDGILIFWGRSEMKKIVLCIMLSISVSLVVSGTVLGRAEQGQSVFNSLREAGKKVGKDLEKTSNQMEGAGKETSRKLRKTGRKIAKGLRKNVEPDDKDADKGFSKTIKDIHTSAARSWNDFLKYMGWD
jgi:hypothetical protein